MGVYDNIKKITDKKDISIYRLERDTGISNGTIARWNQAVPSSANLIKVAKYLGVSLESLLEVEGK